MGQDPQLQKEIWDARVKIVIGRFIMNGFTAFFVLAIAGLLLDNFVMGQQGDAFLEPFIFNWVLPVTAITLVVGFFVNFLPKKKKIDLFTKILYAHKAAESQIVFPAAAIETECFTEVPALGFHDGLRYRVWKTEKELDFFPVHPTIERFAPYERGNVAFAVVAIPLADLLSVEKGAVLSRAYTSYDDKKKPVVANVQHETVALRFGPATVLFDANLIHLIAPAPEAKPAVPSAEAASVPADRTPAQAGGDLEAKLLKLQALFDKGLITEQEYKDRKNKLLDSL